MKQAIRFILLIAAVFGMTPVFAAWFEATGQAIIYNGNKELARQQATQEAIRQAILFSGASVRSVQSMADGLLQDDRFEIRSAGEVASVELIDEVYRDNYVSISIRADIFPQENECSASDYRKSIVTSYFHLENYSQAAVGNMFSIAKPLSMMLQSEFSTYSKYAYINKVEPFAFYPTVDEMKSQAMKLAQKNNSQFVLMGTVQELSVEPVNTTYLDYVTFWETEYPLRNVAIKATLIDGATGETLFEKTFKSTAPWQFDMHASIDVNSDKLWKSSFGSSVKDIIQRMALDIDEAVSCIPSYGRILAVGNNQISASIGREQGVKQGDLLSVFQIKQFFTPTGMPQYQYQVHPAEVIVAQVFHNSSILRVQDGTPLANIQANDFVVRK